MTRSDYHQMVMDSTPGRFEGEPDWTPYYYARMLKGEGFDVWDAGDSEFLYTEFNVAGAVGGLADVALFPELMGAKSVRLYVRFDGFITSEVIR
jgi:hypothetical protein